MVRIRFRHGKKEIPLARRQHAIEAEHSALEGNGSSRSVRLGVPRRRDKRGRRRTVARAIPRSLSLTKYTINKGGAAPRGPGTRGAGGGVASLKGERRTTLAMLNEAAHDLLLGGLDVDVGGDPH